MDSKNVLICLMAFLSSMLAFGSSYGLDIYSSIILNMLHEYLILIVIFFIASIILVVFEATTGSLSTLFKGAL